MKVNNILTTFANSKTGQKFYKYICNPKKDYFLNNTLPQVETVLSTLCYVWSTEKQKNLNKEQKKLLQIQNIGSGIVGIAVSSFLNRKVSKFGEKVIKDIDQTKLDSKSIRQITTGIRITIPLVVTGFLMRCLIPTVLAGFSGKVMDREREKKLNLNA